MYSVYDTRCRVGCPIRISTDQRLLAAPRGFSQRATSFIASWCQGIHRMPFSRSRSRPRIPSRGPPCTETIPSTPEQPPNDSCSQTTTTKHQTPCPNNDPVLDHLDSTHNTRL